jgi:hypothetical protein
MREIRGDRRRPTYRRGRRRMIAVLLPAALLAVAATSYVLLKPTEVVAAGIGCFDRPDLDASVTIVSTTGEDPTSVCGKLWAQGVVKHGVTQIPELIPCVNESGAVLVFPADGASLCSRLDLQALPKGYAKAAQRFVAMRDDLVRRLFMQATAGGVSERSACLDQETALRIANSVLREHEFSDWRAEVASGDYSGRTCANDVGFEDKDKKVLIIPSYRGIDPNPFGSH